MISDQVNTNDHTYKKKTHLINAVTNTQHSSNKHTRTRTHNTERFKSPKGKINLNFKAG